MSGKKSINLKKGGPTTTPASPNTESRIAKEDESQMPLLRNNFIIIGISLLMIIVGFALVAGSPSGVDAYNPDIFSTRRIVVGPMIAFLGFVALAVGIIIKPKK